jgi:hypothetical protein
MKDENLEKYGQLINDLAVNQLTNNEHELQSEEAGV